MTDLADDLPRRKPLAAQAATDAATPGVVWLHPKPLFFCQRDKDNKPRASIAASVVEELRQQHPDVYHLVCFSEAEEALLLELEDLSTGSGDKIQTFRLRKDHAGETTYRLREILGRYGIQFKPVRNIRTVSYLNIHKFVTSNSKLRVIESDDHAALGLSVPKDPSFQDLVERRRRSGWP